MNIQRYDFPCGGILDAYMSEGGRFVLHSEAQARIEALEAALRFYAEKQHIRYGALETRGCDAGWPELLPPEDDATARAALEKQP